MKYLVIKDKKLRVNFFLVEKKRVVSKAILTNMHFYSKFKFLFNVMTKERFLLLNKNFFKKNLSRIKSYCLHTGRSHSVYKFFSMSRLEIRRNVKLCKFYGIKKASW